MKNPYRVNVLSSTCRTLYVGIPNDLIRTVYPHPTKLADGTERNTLTRLVYYQATNDLMAAIEREKRIKGWTRARKLEPVVAVEPQWRDSFPGRLG